MLRRRILRVREAADRTHWVSHRHRRAPDSIGSSHEAVLYRLRNQHQATGNISGGKDMGRGCPQILINLHEPPMIGLNARRRKAQPGGIGRPPHRHDCKRRLSAFPDDVPRKDHSHPGLRLLERLDGADIFIHLDTCLSESRRNRSRYVLILGRQNARAALEQPDSRAKCIENRGDLHPPCPSANDQH
jgi:hypothetical protein